jgi:hypothetical protein
MFSEAIDPSSATSDWQCSVALANATIAACSTLEISGPEAIAAESRFLPSRGTQIDASGIIRPFITVTISVKEAIACVARGDAFSNAIGLPTNSEAFFNTPGTPCAYSGVEINNPSGHRSCDLRSVTEGGWVNSRSGLKCGKFPSPLYNLISTFSGDKAIAALIRVVFDEIGGGYLK